MSPHVAEGMEKSLVRGGDGKQGKRGQATALDKVFMCSLRRYGLPGLTEQRHRPHGVTGLHLQPLGGESIDEQAMTVQVGSCAGNAAVRQATVVDQPHRRLFIRRANGQGQ